MVTFTALLLEVLQVLSDHFHKAVGVRIALSFVLLGWPAVASKVFVSS